MEELWGVILFIGGIFFYIGRWIQIKELPNDLFGTLLLLISLLGLIIIFYFNKKEKPIQL